MRTPLLLPPACPALLWAAARLGEASTEAAPSLERRHGRAVAAARRAGPSRIASAAANSTAFLTGHLGKVRYLPPAPLTAHAYFVVDELGTPDWLEDVLREQGWRVLRLPGSSDHDAVNLTMRSKLAKIPQRRWPQLAAYDFIVWFDDKFRVNTLAALDAIARWPPHAAVSLHRHPRRCVATFPDCSVLEELRASVRQQHRYRRQARRMEAYVEEQERAGWRLAGRPLYQAGFIIYSQRHPETSRFQSTWMEHIRAAGINDQVSLFFVAQRFSKHLMEFLPQWGSQLWAGRELVPVPGESLALLG